MSGSWIGLDPAEVNALATQFDNEAGIIDTAISTITSKLAGTTWQGQDRTNFESEWNSTTTSQLRQAAEALRTAATTARRNATDQETTSSVL